MNAKPLYLFDLDGTLADIEHRRHFIAGKSRRWKAFFEACVDDIPNLPVCIVASELHRSGNDVWIFSGRSDAVRVQTEAWLLTHLGRDIPKTQLLMRRAGDNTPDDVLKQAFLDAMKPADRRRLVAVFDDRDKVVAMWRRNGIACFQVAPGDF